jgi:hypothetical protein
MTARWGIVVGVLAIAAGIAWFAMHRGGSTDGDTVKLAPEGSASLTSSPPATTAAGSATGRDGKIDLTPKTRPERFGSANEQPLPAAGTAFEAEVRDRDWAPATEKEIKRRFSVGVREGKLESAECRQDQCLLTMSGTEEEMTKVLADLETEGGLRGYADHIILDGPVQQNGKLIVRAYAVFDRRAPETN